MSYSLEELAAAAGACVSGDPETRIDGVGTLADAVAGQIAFLTNRKYRRQLAATRASAVILAPDAVEDCPVAALVADNPHAAYARVSALFDHVEPQLSGIHSSAVVEEGAEVDPTAWVGPNSFIGASARVGPESYVGPGCVIGHGTVLGAACRLVANVTVYHGCRLGERVVVHSGAVIGSDGFGFAKAEGRWLKVHQVGAVVIGDDVEIGACTTIDRGAVNDTVIEEGVKLDNQIQVAHNVRVGAHTVIAGCVGIAGSAVIGRNCAIGGGAGILGHLEIADGVTVTPMSLVTKTITQPGVYSSGTPLEPTDQWQKNFVRFKQLDDMARRIRKLEKELEELKRR